MPDHFRGLISQDGPGTRADLNERAPGVRDQDEVLRRLEDALALLDLPIERLLRSPGLADIVRDLGHADDLSGYRSDRRDAERDLDLSAVLVPPQGLVLLDCFTARYAAEDIAHLRAPVGRNDDVDVLADRFHSSISKQPFGGRIPCGDGAVEGLGDDGVVG